MRLLALFLALTGLSLGEVDKWVACIEGISTAIGYITFNGTDPTDYYGTMCTNNLTVVTMWASAKLYCSPKEIEAGSKQLGGYCTEYGGVELIPYSQVAPTLTTKFIASLPRAYYSDVTEGTIFNTSVIISRPFYKTARDTYVIFDLEYILHARYGWAMYGFWGGLLLIGIINRIVSHFLNSRRMKDAAGVEGSTTSKRKSSWAIKRIGSIHHWVRANLIIPTAFGSHHSRPLFWSTIPTRIETIIVTTFYVMVFILCCCGYYIFEPNLYYTRSQQFWRYISDRTGILSYAALPWLWIFSGRNNIFLWLTGWSFATFNIFHRHVARCATLLGIIHSIGWTVLEADYLAIDWAQQYWYMGAIGTISMSFLVLFSFMWFRAKSYEIFLLIHIALSVLTLIGLFYHTKIFDGEYDPYLWPPVAIWCFDRAARIVRWGYCNIHATLGRSLVGTKATATYDKDANIIRIDIVPGSRLLKPGPGQHYYLYQPLKWKGWENHPFTLGAYEDFENSNPPEKTAVTVNLDNPTEKDDEIAAAGPSTPMSSDLASISSKEKAIALKDAVGQQKLSFLVRPFGSWTRRLRDECLKSPTSVITPRIFIEGPYGERSPLQTFENVVFIVGGSGISGALPYILEHMSRTSGNGNAPDSNEKLATRTRDITLLWTTKQSAMIQNVAAHELRQMLKRQDIHIYLHATSPTEQPSAEAISEGKDLKRVHTASTADELNIAYCRPDISNTVLSVIDDVHKAGAAGGRIAILTCGPPGMADEARAAVHVALKQGKREVEYIEETFGW